MISLKNQEVENERKSIYGLQTNLKKMWDNIYNVSEYRSKVRKKARKELLCFMYGLRYWGHHVKIYSGMF